MKIKKIIIEIKTYKLLKNGTYLIRLITKQFFLLQLTNFATKNYFVMSLFLNSNLISPFLFLTFYLLTCSYHSKTRPARKVCLLWVN